MLVVSTGLAAAAAPGSSASRATSSALPSGCERHGSSLRFDGGRGRKRVALTFDDGPAAGTPAFLRALEKLKVHATFFQIGAQVPGNAKLMKRILADGHEIGNHTTHHGSLPGQADMRQTQQLIERATGFRPCLFRPPGGAFNGGTIAAASDLGMTTVIWDVDPQDWRTPGAGAIRANVLGHVRPGSIVVMHDGGGPRGGTLAALPGIVKGLRRRGYRFDTVSELLGYETIYPAQETIEPGPAATPAAPPPVVIP